MSVYISVTIDCNLCGIEQSSESSVNSAVIKWRDHGGECEDDGQSAYCEDCK